MYQDYRKIIGNLLIGLTGLALVLVLAGCSLSIGSAKPISKSITTTTTVAQKETAVKPVSTSTKPNQALAADIYRPQGKWCPTLHLCIESVRWDTYTPSSAEGSGIIRACPPAAKESPCSDVPVKIQFTDPQELCGKTRFSSLILTGAAETATFYLVNDCSGYQGDNKAFLEPVTSSSPESNKLGGVIDCPPSDKNSRVTSARHISCEEAQSDLDVSSIGRGDFYSKQEFLCNASGGLYSYGPDYRCVQGNRSYRFKWSD